MSTLPRPCPVLESSSSVVRTHWPVRVDLTYTTYGLRVQLHGSLGCDCVVIHFITAVTVAASTCSFRIALLLHIPLSCDPCTLLLFAFAFGFGSRAIGLWN